MIKEVKKAQFTKYLEITIEHPVKEFGEFTMFVSKLPDSDTYIFSIPHYNWVYRKGFGEEIKINDAPSGLNHPKYKSQLIAAMNQSIDIHKKNKI